MNGCSRWSWTGYASGRPSRRRRAGRILVLFVVLAKTGQYAGLFAARVTWRTEKHVLTLSTS